MKKFFSFFMMIALVSLLSSSVFAQPQEESLRSEHESLRSEHEFSKDPLTESEKQTLITEGGFNEVDLDRMPPNVLRLILAENGKKISNASIEGYNLESQSGNTSYSDVGTMELTTSDITLYGSAVLMGTVGNGSKKIYLYGDFEWNVEPFWELTDKMSIGYPLTNLWYLETSNGKITGHSSEYCGLNGGLGWKCKSSTTPSDHDLGQGVAAKFDLVGTYTNHTGYVSQYVYTVGDNSGRSNVVFRYGHKLVAGNVGVDLFDFGLAVDPTFNTEHLDYPITFSW